MSSFSVSIESHRGVSKGSWAMQTLELECPSCQEMLELDAGFAGGVCRCSNCGTLMTVPTDAGRAETLSRPSSAADDGPDAGLDDDDPLASLGAATSGEASSGRGASARGGAAVEPGEYRTASGKVVRLDRTVKVPTASKRRTARVATTIVFFGVVAAGVVAGVLVILAIMSSGTGPGGGPGGGDPAVAYDPAANPYDLPFANVAGLPVLGSVAVVVEASADSADWMQPFGDLVSVGLSRPAKGATVALFAAGPDDANHNPIGPTPVAELDADKLTAWFAGLPQAPQPDIAGAIRQAVDTAPDTLILVVTHTDPDRLERWSGLLAEQARLTVHAVVIDGSASETLVREWIEQRGGGELVTFQTGNFAYLKEEAQASE